MPAITKLPVWQCSVYLLYLVLLFTSCASQRHSSTYIKDRGGAAQGKVRLKKKALKRKYAAILHTRPGKIDNRKLYYFIDEWDGVRYKWGGNDKKGIDCSGFAKQLYSTVYGQDIKRTVATQRATTRNFRRKGRLREGDLIYFTEQEDPSHVGIYLKNGYFIHSSKGKGVHISNLNDAYWQKTYAGGGKVRKKKA